MQSDNDFRKSIVICRITAAVDDYFCGYLAIFRLFIFTLGMLTASGCLKLSINCTMSYAKDCVSSDISLLTHEPKQFHSHCQDGHSCPVGHSSRVSSEYV